jgi:hypothetical protein
MGFTDSSLHFRDDRRVYQRLFVPARLLLTAILAVFWTSSTYAVPIDPDGGNPTPAQQAALDCITNAQVHFSASAPVIKLGDSTTVHWLVQFPTECSMLGPLQLNGKQVPPSGSVSMQPMSNSTYSLTILVPQGMSTLSTTSVAVTLPPVVDVKGSTPEWRALMIQAMGTPKTTVRLAGSIDMDLSYRDNIFIAHGVSVVGGLQCDAVSTQRSFVSAATFQASALTPLCGGRSAQPEGPRLYTTTRPNPLFYIRCTDGFSGHYVRLSGFRIQGPHLDVQDGDDNLERGILINSCVGVDIGNMDLSGWSGQAVYIVDDGVAQFLPDAVTIHDSYIHNNQHVGKDGYGIDVALGAWATIERNVFDFNRHAISAYGNPGNGYRANQNLILRGGGYHGSFLSEWTHEFDVHGDRNCPNLPLAPDSLWNCGHAGNEFWITNNAFQYTRLCLQDPWHSSLRSARRQQRLCAGNARRCDPSE